MIGKFRLLNFDGNLNVLANKVIYYHDDISVQEVQSLKRLNKDIITRELDITPTTQSIDDESEFKTLYRVYIDVGGELLDWTLLHIKDVLVSGTGSPVHAYAELTTSPFTGKKSIHGEFGIWQKTTDYYLIRRYYKISLSTPLAKDDNFKIYFEYRFKTPNGGYVASQSTGAYMYLWVDDNTDPDVSYNNLGDTRPVFDVFTFETPTGNPPWGTSRTDLYVGNYSGDDGISAQHDTVDTTSDFVSHTVEIIRLGSVIFVKLDGNVVDYVDTIGFSDTLNIYLMVEEQTHWGTQYVEFYIDNLKIYKLG